MARGYEKKKLVDALNALSIAASMGVFNVSEKRMVLEAIRLRVLSPTVRSMLEGRTGFSNECGQLKTIIDYFEKEDSNYGKVP